MEKNISFIVKEQEDNLRVDVLINRRDELISLSRGLGDVYKRQLFDYKINVFFHKI